MMASDILMSMGSTTASMLKGPMSRSPTAIRLSATTFHSFNIHAKGAAWLSGSALAWARVQIPAQVFPLRKQAMKKKKRDLFDCDYECIKRQNK
jgi:hypothetical protein